MIAGNSQRRSRGNKIINLCRKKDNTCSAQKEKKKIEKKLDPYHADHIQMSALDNLI